MSALDSIKSRSPKSSYRPGQQIGTHALIAPRGNPDLGPPLWWDRLCGNCGSTVPVKTSCIPELKNTVGRNNCSPRRARLGVKKAAVLAALLITGCSMRAADNSETIDAGAAETTPCYCCVWAPGSASPNSDVVCMPGVADGEACEASRAVGDEYPPWAPDATSCEESNPLGEPTKEGI